MRVCVYCASSRGIGQRYADTAREVGTELGRRGINDDVDVSGGAPMSVERSRY